MGSGNEGPLLRLVERSGDEPSRALVAARGPGCAQRAWRALVRHGLALVRTLVKMIGMSSPPQSDDLLSYVPRRDKIVEGVLLMLQQARDAGRTMTTTTLVTAMFLADKAHLDAYGRPVFFDNYVATANGPSGIAATEMLDAGFDWSALGADAAPWSLDATDGEDRATGTREPNMRRLSRSDVRALASAMTSVMALDAGQLRLFTHRNHAYVAAWRDGEGSGARLDPRLVPDERDDEMIEDLLYASRHAFIPARRT